MNTIVVNLMGGSGIGKSTTAALVYGELKKHGIQCELVREFVKSWVYEGRKVGPFGQSIIYGQQLERESSLYGKVDIIVTDSPLIMCPPYQMYYDGHDSIKHVLLKDLNEASKLGVTHLNFLLKRTRPFDPKGRYESEDVAKVIDQKAEAFLVYNDISFVPVNVPDEDKVEFIVSKTLEFYEKSSPLPS